jgi:hypothetical protein
MQNAKAFVLEFGGDEFDDDRFKLVDSSLEVEYIGPKTVISGGAKYDVYEFEMKGSGLAYRDGKAVSGHVFAALKAAPGEGDIGGQAAKVLMFDNVTGAVQPVGRAVLSKVR